MGLGAKKYNIAALTERRSAIVLAPLWGHGTLWVQAFPSSSSENGSPGCLSALGRSSQTPPGSRWVIGMIVGVSAEGVSVNGGITRLPGMRATLGKASAGLL